VLAARLKDSGRPSVLALTRQKLKPARLSYSEENLCARGAYEIASSDKPSEVVIFASGSEVEIAIAAKATLDAAGKPTRVVSVPSMENFEAQDSAYKSDKFWERRKSVSPWKPELEPAGTVSSASQWNLHRHDRLRRVRSGGTAVQAFPHHRRSCGKGCIAY
jgi:pyruvate dehydrogenase complex dehydrogenase (E1) component